MIMKMLIRLLLVTVDLGAGRPGYGDNDSMDDGKLNIDDDNNNQVPGDPGGRQHGAIGLRGGCRREGPKVSMKPIHPALVHLYFNCQIFSAKDDKEAKNYILCRNDCINLQGIA